MNPLTATHRNYDGGDCLEFWNHSHIPLLTINVKDHAPQCAVKSKDDHPKSENP